MSKSYLDLKSAALYRCNQKYYDKVLSGFGLSYSGLIFLISIYEDEGLMLNKLAQDGSFDKGSITKAINKLEENGFVVIQDSKKDKRAKELYTTQKTRDLMPKLYQIRQEYLNYLSEDLNEEEVETLNSLMDKVLLKAREYSKTNIDIQNIQISNFIPLSFIHYDNLSTAVIQTGGCNFRCRHCENKNLVFLSSSSEKINVSDVLNYLNKRQNMLQVVVVEGGEPLLHDGIVSLLQELRELDLNIKLCTNGSQFERLKQIVDLRLADEIEVKIMGSKSYYAKYIGLESFDTSNIDKTINLLINGNIKYCFTLTLTDEEIDYEELGRWLKDVKCLKLRRYNKSDECIDKSIEATPKEKLSEIIEILNKYVKEIKLEGYDV